MGDRWGNGEGERRGDGREEGNGEREGERQKEISDGELKSINIQLT